MFTSRPCAGFEGEDPASSQHVGPEEQRYRHVNPVPSPRGNRDEEADRYLEEFNES